MDFDKFLDKDFEAVKRSLSAAKRKVEREVQFNKKVALNGTVKALESQLRRMRTEVFNAEDAARIALEKLRVELFAHYSELFPRAYNQLRLKIAKLVKDARFEAMEAKLGYFERIQLHITGQLPTKL